MFKELKTDLKQLKGYFLNPHIMKLWDKVEKK